VYLKEINGIRFAVCVYTYGTNGIPLPKGKEYMVSLLEEGALRRDLAAAQALRPDFIIVLPHMGNEYETYPREVFKNWARLMFEAGADLVLASHPHVLQPAEWVEIPAEDGSVRRCFAAYSLGNFVSSQRTLPRDAGVILNLRFEKTAGKAVLAEVSFIPTWVKFINSGGVYDIQVLPVDETLAALAAGADVGLRPKDAARLREVQREAREIFPDLRWD
jgi:poly-gamma-glutamate synthesis protein (capsule biosynthesis protein)